MGKALGELEKRSKREWSALYGRQARQQEQLAEDCQALLERFRAGSEQRSPTARVNFARRDSTLVYSRAILGWGLGPGPLCRAGFCY